MGQSGVAVGMHERHLLRRDGNPLFALPPVDYSGNDYIEARQRDNAELQQFHQEMRSVIQQAIELETNVESEVILELRGKLDKLYARCSSFGSGCSEHKQNIRKLTDLVMKAVWQAAGNDPQARMELEQEEMARQQHYRLLEYPLVADLLRLDTPIDQQELVPTLLQAGAEELEAAIWMFEPQQLQQLCEKAERLLTQCRGAGHELSDADNNLMLLKEHLSSSA